MQYNCSKEIAGKKLNNGGLVEKLLTKYIAKNPWFFLLHSKRKYAILTLLVKFFNVHGIKVYIHLGIVDLFLCEKTERTWLLYRVPFLSSLGTGLYKVTINRAIMHTPGIISIENAVKKARTGRSIWSAEIVSRAEGITWRNY